MILARVLGNIWATRKEESLNGLKFLIVQPVDWDGRLAGATFVAADKIGAGVGELVLVTRGSSARRALGPADAPIDAIVTGIIDMVEVEKSRQAMAKAEA